MNEVDFGGGIPKSVGNRPVANWPGFIFLLPLCGGGVRAYLRLHTEEMPHFTRLMRMAKNE